MSDKPQTFEDVMDEPLQWIKVAEEQKAVIDALQFVWDAAFAAGVASQQAEFERLNAERVDPATGFLWSVKAEAAEEALVRYEAVMEAARELNEAWGPVGDTMTVGSPYAARLRAALAALDESK